MIDKILDTICGKDKAIYEMSENENYYIVTTANKFKNAPEDEDKTFIIDKNTLDITESADEFGNKLEIPDQYKLAKYQVINELNRKWSLKEKRELFPKISKQYVDMAAFIACTKGANNIQDLYTITNKIADELNSRIFNDSELTLEGIRKNAFAQFILNDSINELLNCAQKYYWKPDLVDDYYMYITSLNVLAYTKFKYNKKEDEFFKDTKNKVLNNISKVLDVINNTENIFLNKDIVRGLVLEDFEEAKKSIAFYEGKSKELTKYIQETIEADRMFGGNPFEDSEFHTIKPEVINKTDKTENIKKALNTFKGDLKSIGKDISKLVKKEGNKKYLSLDEAYKIVRNINPVCDECYRVHNGYLFIEYNTFEENERKCIFINDNKNIRIDLTDDTINKLIKSGNQVELNNNNTYDPFKINETTHYNDIDYDLILGCNVSKKDVTYIEILKEIFEVCDRASENNKYHIKDIEKKSKYYNVTLDNNKVIKIKCNKLDSRKDEIIGYDDIENGKIYVPRHYRRTIINDDLARIYQGKFIYDRIKTISMEGGFGGLPLTEGSLEDHCEYINKTWGIKYFKQIIRADGNYVFEVCGEHGENLGIAPIIIKYTFGDVISSIYPIDFYYHKGDNIDVPQNYRPVVEDKFIPNEPTGDFGRLSGVAVPTYTLGQVDPLEGEDVLLEQDKE